MQQYRTPTFDVNLDLEGFVVDLDSLFDRSAQLQDSRHARGGRYAWVTILVFVLLAKLAGENQLTGFAEWVQLRKELLAEALHLKKPRGPPVSTYRRLLGFVVDVKEFEQIVRDFVAAQPHTGERIAILNSLGLRDKTIAGDAAFAQRALSAQIVEAGGDSVWSVKGNQAELEQDIATLFAPEPGVKGFSPASQDDFRTTTERPNGMGAWNAARSP